jgi:hypothetical protein
MHEAMKKKSLAEFTRAEFLKFVDDTFRVIDPENNDLWVDHFIKLVPHPAGSDLLFWPAEGVDDSPEGVVAEVECYCAQNDLPCFSDS